MSLWFTHFWTFLSLWWHFRHDAWLGARPWELDTELAVALKPPMYLSVSATTTSITGSTHVWYTEIPV